MWLDTIIHESPSNIFHTTGSCLLTFTVALEKKLDVSSSVARDGKFATSMCHYNANAEVFCTQDTPIR